MRRHADRARPSPITAEETEKILAGAGFEPGVSREAAHEAVEQTRARDHERWNALATQYLAWDGHSDRMSPLGRISQPIVVVDGRYLVSAMTISRQGGQRGIERLFQTANRIIRRQTEKRELATKEGSTMNMTAIALATTVCVGLAACGPTNHEAETQATSSPARPTVTKRYMNLAREGVTRVSAVEVVADGAHLRLTESGKVMRLTGLQPLEGEEARKAVGFLRERIGDKRVACWWYPRLWRKKDPRVSAPDGTALGICSVRKNSYQGCNRRDCGLAYEAVKAGFGRYEGGPWEQRSRNAGKFSAELREAEEEARRSRRGIWHASADG